MIDFEEKYAEIDDEDTPLRKGEESIAANLRKIKKMMNEDQDIGSSSSKNSKSTQTGKERDSSNFKRNISNKTKIKPTNSDKSESNEVGSDQEEYDEKSPGKSPTKRKNQRHDSKKKLDGSTGRSKGDTEGDELNTESSRSGKQNNYGKYREASKEFGGYSKYDKDNRTDRTDRDRSERDRSDRDKTDRSWDKDLGERSERSDRTDRDRDRNRNRGNKSERYERYDTDGGSSKSRLEDSYFRENTIGSKDDVDKGKSKKTNQQNSRKNRGSVMVDLSPKEFTLKKRRSYDNIHENDSESNFSDDNQNKEVDEEEFREMVMKKLQEMGDGRIDFKSPIKLKVKYDEKGNIILNPKNTQDLLASHLGSIRETHREHGSSRRRTPNDSPKSSSPNLSMLEGDDDEAGFQTLHIVHQEIRREDGETEIVPVTIKMGNRKINVKKQNQDQKKRRPIITEDSKASKDSDDSIEVMIDENGVPIIVKKSSNKKGNQGSKIPTGGLDSPQATKKWTAKQLIEALENGAMDDMDPTLRKELKKQLQAQLNEAFVKFDAHQKRMGTHSDRLDTKQSYDPYKPSEPRRPTSQEQKVRTTRSEKRNTSAPSGLYHLGHFPLFGETPSLDDDTTGADFYKHFKSNNKDNVDMWKIYRGSKPIWKQLPKNNFTLNPNLRLKKPISMSTTDLFFYTPFKGQLDTRRIAEYHRYLNSLLFAKKLDEIILDFLINQFVEVQQRTLGLTYDPSDSAFRAQFKKTYRKLIVKLRERLFRNKSFIGSTYTKMYMKMLEPENLEENFRKDIEGTQSGFQLSPNGTRLPNLHIFLNPSYNKRLNTSTTEKNSSSRIKLPEIPANKRITQTEAMRRTKTDKILGASLPRTESIFDDTKLRPADSYDPEPQSDSEEEEEEKDQTIKGPKLAQKEIDGTQLVKKFTEIDSANYLHYWKLLGDPCNLDCSYLLSKIPIPDKIHTYHIVLMAQRLGIKLESSEEPDLAWIAYLALIAKIPEKSEAVLSIGTSKDKLYQKVCYMKPGEHPGDNYFKTLTAYQQAKRHIVLEHMQPEQRAKYVKSQSWVKMKYEKGNIYYFNFMTKQKADSFPSDLKDAYSALSTVLGKKVVKDSLKALNSVMLKNDELFAYFKTKK